MTDSLGVSHGFPRPLAHKLESLRGPGFSNIVIRDALLHGAHPGSSTAEIVTNLKPLLAAGVTTFVCLQMELPSAATAAAAQSRATTFGGGSGAAKPYISGAQAMVDAGGYAQSGSKLSFVHYPMPGSPGFCPPEALVKQIVRRRPRARAHAQRYASGVRWSANAQRL